MDVSRYRSAAAIAIAAGALFVALGGSALGGGWHHLDLTRTEPFHLVGARGEPPLSNGGQGDCVWDEPQPGTLSVDGLNPAAFYRDATGEVHLVGVVEAVAGTGGDGQCGNADALEDMVVFTLPAGYRPENVELANGGGHTIVIVPDEGATIGGEPVPAGAVLPVDGFGLTVLDGISFRVAGPGTRPISATHAPSLGSVRELDRELD
jgi:hypothetical protein